MVKDPGPPGGIWRGKAGIMTITVELDCYNCGETIEIPYWVNHDTAEHRYCKNCYERLEVRYKAGRLKIVRLGEET
jgi:hypothetical protein